MDSHVISDSLHHPQIKISSYIIIFDFVYGGLGLALDYFTCIDGKDT
jgi:hypothetical protein